MYLSNTPGMLFGPGLCGWVVGGGPLGRFLGLFVIFSCVGLDVVRRGSC